MPRQADCVAFRWVAPISAASARNARLTENCAFTTRWQVQDDGAFKKGSAGIGIQAAPSLPTAIYRTPSRQRSLPPWAGDQAQQTGVEDMTEVQDMAALPLIVFDVNET